MKRPEFTKKEMEILRKNKNVLNCTSKRVKFTREFKEQAVEQYRQGWTPVKIFTDADINISIISRKVPKELIRGWIEQLETKGNLEDKQGTGNKNRRVEEKIPKDEKQRLKYLEAKVAYLEKENSFLAKLRGKRAE